MKVVRHAARQTPLVALVVCFACSSPGADPPPATPSAPPLPGDADPRSHVEPLTRDAFVIADPEAEGIDSDALARLVATAEAQHSEALVIVKNGKLVFESYFGKADEPIMAMSASKSFTSLAYGFLLEEGKLASLDEPVAKTLPAFASDARKAKVTFRHLLSQTSGLDPKRAGGSKGDIEANAASVSCLFEPGTSWQYSNGGIDLLAALAGRLAGKPMDQYLDEKLFRPLGVADVEWMRDKKGVPLGAGEMLIRPLDLAKVGQVLLDGGRWRSAPVVPASWIGLSFAQSSPFEPLYGLLWWRTAAVTSVGLTAEIVAQWTTAGLSADIAAKMEPLVGQHFATTKQFNVAVRHTLSASEGKALDDLVMHGDHLPVVRNLTIGTVTGYDASGWLGQYLVIAPERNLVAVRMRRARDSDYGGGPAVDGYPAFPSDASAIVR